MKKVALGAATIGLALVAAGCSDNVIGGVGPQPGLAAQVDGTEISLEDLDSATDGLCTLQEADPNVPGTSRAFAQSQILQAWVVALIAEEYATDQDLDVQPPDAGLELAPGWDDVDDDDRDALSSYVDAFVFSTAVQQALGEELPDISDYDVTINPRFDVKIEGFDFVPAGAQLSVPVSDEATATDLEPPTVEELRALPEDELCGKRPAAEPPVPLG